MQNGTQPACAIQLGTAGFAATASQTTASESSEIIGTEASSQPLLALYRGREITVTVAFTQPSSRDSSAAEEDESDGIVPYFPDPSAADDAVTTRLSKKRGGNDCGSDGKWRAGARATDFGPPPRRPASCAPPLLSTLSPSPLAIRAASAAWGLGHPRCRRLVSSLPIASGCSRSAAQHAPPLASRVTGSWSSSESHGT